MARMPWAFVFLTLLENVIAQSSNGKQAPVIITQPSNTFASKGGIVELTCKASGPSLKYTWYHNDKVIQQSRRRDITPNGNLFIHRFLHKKRKGSDTGRYYCIVYNEFGNVKSKVVNITLGYIRNSFRKHPSSQGVPEGGKLTLTCTPPRGKPKPDLKWLKDGHVVIADGKKVLVENKNQRLVIGNFQKDDEGSYKCEATNLVARRLSNPATVVRISLPIITEAPKDQVVVIGVDRSVVFTCKADGNPKPKFEWRKDGNTTVLPSTNGLLTLDDLKISDAGVYTCSASNSQGSVSKRARLTVNYPPQFTLVSPDSNEREGSTLRLSCLANAQPAPSILWRNNGTGQYYKPYEKYGNIYVNQDDRTVILVISDVKKSNEGTYICQATNPIGLKERVVKVSVHSKTEFAPVITTNATSVTADINSDQVFICDVDGSPKPVVHWSRVGHGKDLGAGTIVTDYPMGKRHRYVLDVKKVQQSNAGTFQCHAVNRINKKTQDFVIKVTRRLLLSEPIGVDVPPMPTGVVINDWTHNSVLISWNKIITTSAVEPIVLFAVGYINVDKRSKESYASSSILPSRVQFMVEGLQPSTRYRFFVRVINKNGPGPPSLLSDIITTNPAITTTPTLPTIIPVQEIKLQISVHDGDPGELVVSWKKSTNYAAIDGYYIYWRVIIGKQRREVLRNGRAESYTITDLQNSTAYKVKVQVFKDKTKGVMSNVVHQKTSKEVIVLEIEVTRNDTDSFVITWQRLWKKHSGGDKVKNYAVWCSLLDNDEEANHHVIPADLEQYQLTVGGLTPGKDYKVWMVATTINGHHYFSKKQKFNTMPIIITETSPSKSLGQEIKEFVLQAWFLGLLGGLIILLILLIVFCCFCKRSSSKNDDLPIPLQDRNNFEAIRKPSETANTESEMTTIRSQGRESCDADNLSGRSSRDCRHSGTPSVPTPTSLDFPQVAITPNRLYRSPDSRTMDEGNTFGRSPRPFPSDYECSKPRYNSRTRNPYSPSPKPDSLSSDSRNENSKGKYPPSSNRSLTRSPYPDAPPDYETAIAENVPRDEKASNDRDDGENKDGEISPLQKDRYGNPSSRQSSRSPSSECSNQGSSIAGRRKGLKPLPRLTIASVNWADMLPPPPSHPPPSSVATRSPPPSPTATSMCSETTYGRSHASSFLPRRSASVVSGDMTSDLEKATADSVLSGKSKGKSENKLPFDLAGITSDIIMQWADSVTNTSGSDNESQCSSPSRISGISSDGSFLTDTDFANAVKAAAECGGFNIDIDLNMYKDMDPISFQPFAGSLSTYNPDNSTEPNKESKPTNKVSNGSKDGGRDCSRSSRNRRQRNDGETRPANPSIKETSPLITPTADPMVNKNPRKSNELNGNGSAGYVPALTRTSALGQLEPVNRGPIKKKYAVVKTLPQVQSEEGGDFAGNYPSHSLSSSTSNASTIRSSSCPPIMLTDDEEDMLYS